MKISCDSCGAKFNLSDDKVKPGVDLPFTCPKCLHKNVIKVPSDEPRVITTPTATHVMALEDQDEMVGDFFEEGARPAMICFDPGPVRDQLQDILAHLGYVTVVSSSTRDAIKRLRLSQFRLVILHENYDRQTLETNAVLSMVNSMEMSVRRRFFVALFGKNFQTMDQMTAFSLSVNMVINLADEEQYEKILKRGINEYNRFYKVFFDVLREVGKI